MSLTAILTHLCQFRATRAWKILSQALRILLGILFLVASLWRVDLANIAQQIIKAHFGWLALAILSVFLSTALKIARWGWLLNQFGVRTRWQQTIGAFLVGQAANIVLPVRAGELFRIGWISAEAPDTTGGVVAAILIEKYLDLVALVVLLFGFGGNLVVPPKWQIPGMIAATIFLISAAWFGPRIWKNFSARLLPHLPAWTHPWMIRLDRLAASAQWLRQPNRIILALGITALTWLVMAATNLFVLAALDMPVDLQASILVLTLVYVGVAPALGPGNMGPFYFFAILGLKEIAVTEAQRATFAVLLHALGTLLILIMAGAYLIVRPGSRSQIKNILDSRKVDPTPVSVQQSQD